MPDVPNYGGNLTPTEWSAVRLTPEAMWDLGVIADPDCIHCRGDGFLPSVLMKDRYLICSCTRMR